MKLISLKISFFTIFFLFLFCVTYSQQDSLSKKQVNILPIIQLKAQPIQHINTNQLPSASIADALSDHPEVFIKNYGSGQLSTASFRGMSANHTLVTWQNIPLNSPSLGLTDLSLFPSRLFDKTIYHSGAGRLQQAYGGLGGQVALYQQADTLIEHWHGQFQQSFSELLGWNTSAVSTHVFQINKHRFHHDTRLSTLFSKNQFRYKDDTQAGHPVVKAKNSQFRQLHLMESLSWFPGSLGKLKTNIWLSDNRRQLPFSPAEQEDRFIRATMNWETSKYNLQIAYLNEEQIYNDEVINLNAQANTSRLFARANYYLQHKKWSWQSGLELIQDEARTGGYSIKKQQNIASFFSLLKWYPLEDLIAYADIRETWRSTYFPNFIYSIGLSYDILNAPKRYLNLKFNQYKNIHYPNLNDLYWEPGGNSELNPEQILGVEVELEHIIRSFHQNRQTHIGLSGFYSILNDRILWQPSNEYNFWTATNVNKVRSNGLDAYMILKQAISNFSFQGNINYSITYTTDLLTNKQLIYTPIQQGNFSFQIQGNEQLPLGLKYRHHITGKRYTTSDNTGFLSAYQSGDVSINYRFSKRLNINSIVHNLWNVNYEIIEGRPLPLRYIEIGVGWNID